ncbi:uncharacterized protein LOC118784459 [Megalops cyprinoides]|uniref:uncharacterized protein LOC118784459 n=1 Tax=Megalops cyprinoides TaxID=118141 RepID=UPI001863DA4D|nr:uncharacterized protein LOC118784459 [Megalops cyprinoides]
MECHLSIHLFFIIYIIGCEGGPYFNDDKGLTLHDNKDLDWMAKRVNDETLLSTVTIPGTYQSMKINTFDQHQVWKLEKQFEAGVRFFDISLSDNVVKDGSPRKSMTFLEVMNIMMSLLAKHQKETILLRLTPEDKKSTKAVEAYIQSHKNKVWDEATMPKMSQVRQKIVFVQSPKFNKGLMVHSTNVGEKKFKSTGENMEKIKKYLQDAKDKCSQHLALTETTAEKLFKSASSVAKDLNPEIHKYLADLLKDPKKPKCLGVISVDFPGPDLIKTIFDFNSDSGSSSDGSAGAENAEAPPPPEAEGE